MDYNERINALSNDPDKIFRDLLRSPHTISVFDTFRRHFMIRKLLVDKSEINIHGAL